MFIDTCLIKECVFYKRRRKKTVAAVRFEPRPYRITAQDLTTDLAGYYVAKCRFNDPNSNKVKRLRYYYSMITSFLASFLCERSINNNKYKSQLTEKPILLFHDIHIIRKSEKT